MPIGKSCPRVSRLGIAISREHLRISVFLIGEVHYRDLEDNSQMFLLWGREPRRLYWVRSLSAPLARGAVLRRRSWAGCLGASYEDGSIRILRNYPPASGSAKPTC